MGKTGLKDERFYKKKRILAQRNQLLERIGQAAFERGDLPAEFAQLPHEFQRMAILLGQLHDRYHALKKDRDRVHFQLDDLLNRLARQDNKYALKLRQPYHDRDELSIKIRYQKEQQPRGLLRFLDGAENMADLEQRMAKIQTTIAELEKAKRQALAALKNEIEPLEERLNRLDGAIQAIQDEENHLSSDRQYRLRDLGRWYRQRKAEDRQFLQAYAQLDNLNAQLIGGENDPIPLEPVGPKKRTPMNWLPMVVCILLSLGVIFAFRTQFHTRHFPLRSLLGLYPADAYPELFYADLERGEFAEALPSLERVLEYAGLASLKPERLSALILVRDDFQSDVVRAFGLRFRQPNPGIVSRLYRQGWRYLSSDLGMEAMTDGRFVWLVYNPRTFIMIPLEMIDSLETLSEPREKWRFLLQSEIAPRGNHSPLLQGLDRFRFEQFADRFVATWSTEQHLTDLSLRKTYLKALMDLPRENEMTLAFQGDQLEFRGPVALLEGTARDAEALSAQLYYDIEILERRFHQGADLKPDLKSPLKDAFSGTGAGAYLRVFDQGGDRLRLLAESALGGPFHDMIYLKREKALLLSEDHSLKKVVWNGQRLKEKEPRGRPPVFPPGLAGSTEARFLPGILRTDPEENLVLALSGGWNWDLPSSITLLQLPDLQPMWRQELPVGLYGLDAQWDAAGRMVYVSVAARKTQRGRSPAVLVYQLENGTLGLMHSLETDHDSEDWSLPLALNSEPNSRGFFFFHLTSQRLVHGTGPQDPLVGLSLAPDDTLPVHYQPGGELPRGLVFPNRTGRALLLLSGQHVLPSESRSTLQLVDLTKKEPTLIQSRQLNMDPSDGLRIPLSDRFWICSPEARELIKISLDDSGFRFKESRTFDYFRPRLLACDELGRYLFCLGSGGASP